MVFRHTEEPEKLGPSGAEEVEGWMLVPCGCWNRVLLTSHISFLEVLANLNEVVLDKAVLV